MSELDKKTIDKSYEFHTETKGTIKIENVFKECYELDSNSQPARFRLKYLDRLFPEMNQRVNKLFVKQINN